jgi:hypothetical protein
VPVFLTLILTLGRTLPDESWTTPESVAVVVCPNATPTASSAIGNAADRSLFKRLDKIAEALHSLKLFILYPPKKVSFGGRQRALSEALAIHGRRRDVAFGWQRAIRHRNNLEVYLGARMSQEGCAHYTTPSSGLQTHYNALRCAANCSIAHPLNRSYTSRRIHYTTHFLISEIFDVRLKKADAHRRLDG